MKEMCLFFLTVLDRCPILSGLILRHMEGVVVEMVYVGVLMCGGMIFGQFLMKVSIFCKFDGAVRCVAPARLKKSTVFDKFLHGLEVTVHALDVFCCCRT